MNYSLPNAWRRPDVLVSSFAINILALALPIVILQFYDRIIPNQSSGTFWALTAGMFVVVCLDLLIKTLRSTILSWEGARFDHKASVDAMDQILQADNLAFESRPAGFYIDRIHALENIQEFYSGQSILLLIDFPFVLIYLVLICVIAGPLVFIPLVLLAVFLLVSVWTGRQLRDSLESRSNMEDRRQNFVIELLHGIHTAKSMAMESLMLRRYERLQYQSAESIYDLSKVNSISQGFGASFSQLAVISFVGIGAIAVVHGALTVGGLAAGTMLTSRVLQPGLRAMGVWTQFQSVRLAIKKVNELFSIPLESDGQYKCEKAVGGKIELKHVSFSYQGTEEPLLKDLSLVIEPGEMIGLTGNNGAGKSTLISLLSGFLQPETGSISIDQHPLSDFDIEFLRSQIGIVPQHGVIFEGTILENMTLYREGEAAEQAIAIAASLGLGEIISKFPDGLDTYIGGSAASSLSEGVKQMIVIVRSLVGNPKIIFFDDSNANFDVKNDKKLIEVIKEMKGSRTMVVVSHRPSLLRLCDRNFKLQAGELQACHPFEAPVMPMDVERKLSMAGA
ncbi:MAG: ATP-binding cassette domain-containing protein [Pseudomonadales bacterium]|nr:ATP-binding cassette domain-containing protein [Halioglobus sp.]MCP5194654.1 ATP-binding cassette domain-containing protein [Pseudomonadales bacterium]